MSEWEHIHQDPVDQQWYFWNETGNDRCGPYPTALDASIGEIRYCLECLGNYPPDQEAGMRLILKGLEERKQGDTSVSQKHASEI